MQQKLEIGQIVNTFGIKGEIKITPFTDDIKRFDNLKEVYVKTKKDSKLFYYFYLLQLSLLFL